MKNKKSLGQNWLKNREILEKIADYAGEGPLCVEIGPGLGFLTSSLFRRFEKVIAVEFDAELAQKLPGSFPGKNLEVVNEDILKFDFKKVPQPFVVAGNIPYYITSPIIEELLTLETKPERIVLLVQKEVAERVVSNKETVLSLFVKNRAKVIAGPVVARTEFTPPPKVDSEVLVMEPLKKPVVDDEVFKLIKAGFITPRKKLIHNLSNLRSKEELEKIFAELGLDINARPSDLALKDWARLDLVL